LPITHKDKFKKIGIRPPKGCLMFGPPGTGKTMMARACAGQTKATFLKLAGTSLVQMYIGDGPKMVRDAFALAKAKAPTIIFIDEIVNINEIERAHSLNSSIKSSKAWFEFS
jgi:26S proteasome regulatory subunit T5